MSIRIAQRVGGSFLQDVLFPALAVQGTALASRVSAAAQGRVALATPGDPDRIVELFGVGLAPPGGPLTGGVVQRIRILQDAAEIAVIDGLSATAPALAAAADALSLSNDAAPLAAMITAGGAVFNGAFSGRQVAFRGGAGDDVVLGGAAAEIVDGGGGFDRISYAAAAAAVGIRLDGGASTGAARGDVLRDVEGATGSAFADQLTGSAAANLLEGGPGGDRLFGLAGDDTLDGGPGGDLMDGGAGFDTVAYASSGVGVGARLDGGANFNGAAGDVIRNVEALIGSAFSDALVGSAGANMLAGGGGGDRLFGLAGADTLAGGAGRDLIDGGDGFDTASYIDSAVGVGARLDGGANFNGAAGDAIRNVEALTGSNFADALVGNDGGNILRGLAGADRLFGLGGNDLLLPGAGRDRVDGGDGVDTVSYADAGAAAGARLDGGVNFGVATGDVILNVENIVGSRFADRLVGSDGANAIEGGAGPDALFGLGGADRFVYAGAGFGQDVVRDWQDGVDRIDFRLHEGVGAFSDLVITQSGPNARIGVGADAVFLAGVDAATVTEADVLITPRVGAGGDDVIKGVLNVAFSGFEAKMGLDLPDLGSIAVASAGEEITVQTLQSGDLIGLARLRADQRFAGIDGSGQTVVVLDTGIDLNHPAFGPDADRDGVSDRIVFAQDFSNDGDNNPDDVQGHGTNVSSIIGSSDPRFLGVAPGVDIIHLQVLDNDGRGASANIEQALQWVVRNAAAYNVAAVNLSLGPGNNINRSQAASGGYADEFAALRQLGVVTTVAAGNSYAEFRAPGMSSIAVDPNVIGIGATWDAAQGNFNSDGVTQMTGPDRITFFSQRSPAQGLDTLFAPGALITGAAPGGGSSAQGGTSQAAPHVAGLVALAQQLAQQTIGRRLTPDEFEQVVRGSARRINDGDDEADNLPNTGADYDRIDAFAMAEAILALSPGPTPNPNPPPAPGDVPGGPNTTAVFNFQPISGQIGAAGDQDWYRVALEAGAVYRFELLGAESGAGSLSDPLLVLRDARGGVVVQDDDGGAGLESLIEFRAAAGGTFFLSAQAFGDATGGFQLRGARAAAPVGELPEGPNTPSVLRSGVSVQGVIDFEGDRDWHRLDLTAGTRYTVSLSGTDGRDGLEDPYLRIVNAQGDVLRQDDDGGEGLDSALEFVAEGAGAVFVSAGAFGDFDTGRYTIRVETAQAVADIPDGSATSARVAPGGSVSSTLDFIGDNDWIAADLPAGRYRADLVSPDGAIDPLLRLRDANLRVVDVDDDGGEGLNSQLDFTTSGGRVFLVAASYGNDDVGAYRLSLTSLGAGGGDVPGGPTTTVRAPLNDVTSSAIDTPGDRDWFVFDAPANGLYGFALTGSFTAGDALDDPLIRLRDASGRLLAQDDDGGDGLNAFLVTPLAAGRYFLEAGAFGDASSGDYDLFVVT